MLRKESEVRSLGLKQRDFDDHVLRRAFLILKYAHESATAFRRAFDIVRGPKRGTPKDEEQDLLRAMLVMAAAGLDSVVKQIFRDSLDSLIEVDDNVQSEFEKFVSRRVRGKVDEEGQIGGADFLARVMVAESWRQELIEQYVTQLTGSSLQSASELTKASKALGISTDDVFAVDASDLRKIFRIRNAIIHELDVNFDAAKRNRESRARDDIVGYANALLETAEAVLAAVQGKLAT